MKRRAPIFAVLSALVFSPNTLARAPFDQYANFGDASPTIRDLFTRLEWTRAVSSKPLSWNDADSECKSQGGGTPFRLPTVKELQTLVDEQPTLVGTTPRYLDSNAFPAETSKVSIRYWTATATGNGGERFAMDFATGATSVAAPDKELFVRCVRTVP